MIGQHLGDNVPGLEALLSEQSFAGEHDQRLPQRPAPASGPGPGVGRQRGPEPLPARPGEEGPGDHRVAGRIPHPTAAEVDDRAQRAVCHQQVPVCDVAVHPHRRAVPGGGQRRLPHPGRGRPVDPVAQRLDGRPRLGVVHGQRGAAEEVVFPGRRSALGAGSVQRGEERGQIGRELVHVADPGRGRWLPLQPPVNRPVPGVSAPRHAQGQRRRNRQRQLPGQHRQPPVLLGHLRGAGRPAWQPHRHIPAETERPVVPPVLLNAPHRQPGPLRELSRDQA
jgi:hypothetical protein